MTIGYYPSRLAVAFSRRSSSSARGAARPVGVRRAAQLGERARHPPRLAEAAAMRVRAIGEVEPCDGHERAAPQRTGARHEPQGLGVRVVREVEAGWLPQCGRAGRG